MKIIQIRRLKKLWVEVSPELYQALQDNAAKRNIRFTTYINRSLWRSLLKEESYESDQGTFDTTVIKKT